MSEKNVNPQANVGSQADVEAIMRKYDRESNTRIWQGKPGVAINILLAAFSLFCIYVTLFANFLEQVRLSSFMGLILIIGYIIFPIRKGHVRVNYMPWYDIVFMVLGAAAFFYYTFNAETLVRMRLPLKLKNPVYLIAGIIGILSLAELCRRSVGLPILCVAAFFVGYTIYHYISNGSPLAMVPHELFYNENGILTTPVSVCSKYIVVFIIFGAFLERTGISDFFISLANSLAGSSAGGPAKVAVISSALCGMVSGSSVGNTVTTGSVTIPMMKKTGYRPEFAAAVEASASTGGQIMPPVMGAAAFLMAEYVGVSYSSIIVRAILPAFLYFLGIFIAVHLEAKRQGLRGLSREELPRFKALVKDTYLLLPLLVLVALVCTNAKTMQFSAAVAILAAVLVGIISNIVNRIRLNKAEGRSAGDGLGRAAVGADGGFGAKKIFESLAAGGKGCITVGVACGMAGVICGCITITGLAGKIISGIVTVSGSSTFLALFLTMLCCIVLGMGVPTTANYCIMASTCAPILIQMGIPTIASHFFVFYFGIVADITPPVALAAYAGSAIAKSNPMKTGVTATRLAIAAFIIPFVFAYSPKILFVDAQWYEVVQIAATAIVGMIGIGAGLSRYLVRKMSVVESVISLAGGLLLIIPGTLTDLLGVLLVALVFVYQVIMNRKEKS